MSIVIASAHIDDEEFLRAFHSCELPAACFRHGDHLRLAWLRPGALNSEAAKRGWLAPDRQALPPLTP